MPRAYISSSSCSSALFLWRLLLTWLNQTPENEMFLHFAAFICFFEELPLLFLCWICLRQNKVDWVVGRVNKWLWHSWAEMRSESLESIRDFHLKSKLELQSSAGELIGNVHIGARAAGAGIHKCRAAHKLQPGSWCLWRLLHTLSGWGSAGGADMPCALGCGGAPAFLLAGRVCGWLLLCSILRAVCVCESRWCWEPPDVFSAAGRSTAGTRGPHSCLWHSTVSPGSGSCESPAMGSAGGRQQVVPCGLVSPPSQGMCCGSAVWSHHPSVLPPHGPKPQSSVTSPCGSWAGIASSAHSCL